jgi:hypothetical protein
MDPWANPRTGRMNTGNGNPTRKRGNGYTTRKRGMVTRRVSEPPLFFSVLAVRFLSRSCRALDAR